MHKEETTFSEDLMSPSWKDWVRENKLFLSVIGGLSGLSLFLMIQNLTHSMEPNIPLAPQPIESLSSPLKPKMKTTKKVSKPKDPFHFISELIQNNEMDKAIQELITFSIQHKDIYIRKKASLLIKHYRAIQQKREETKKYYLQGYVLFQTYPYKACEQWKEALKSQDADDPYVQKSQKRYQENCR